MRYLMTHSLLYSWLYAMKENPFAANEEDPWSDFMQTLRRVRKPPNEAMRNGIDFEDLVTDIVNGQSAEGHKWYEPAKKIADIVKGGQLQLVASTDVNIDGIDLLLYGRLDALKAGTIYDIKFSKSYDRGKYFTSTQHPMYFKIVPEARTFSYLVSNGTDVWTETYTREETPDIEFIASDFLTWLKSVDLMPEYEKYWVAK